MPRLLMHNAWELICYTLRLNDIIPPCYSNPNARSAMPARDTSTFHPELQPSPNPLKGLQPVATPDRHHNLHHPDSGRVVMAIGICHRLQCRQPDCNRLQYRHPDCNQITIRGSKQQQTARVENINARFHRPLSHPHSIESGPNIYMISVV